MLEMPSDVMCTRPMIDANCTTSFPNSKEWMCNEKTRTQVDICCFTDTSKSEQDGICYRNAEVGRYYNLGLNTTILQAEIYAIETCAGKILNKSWAQINKKKILTVR